ncbi:MAG TPA: ABC transporter permease subunit [Verrucomicrobiae bacterium]|jgi:ABC-type transport system involved in multi-copper enzyme maturation permease subunit
MNQANYYPTIAAAPLDKAPPWWIALNNIQAISGVVIKELYRRKDFYVLFILTALLTVAMGSVNFFNEEKIVRCVKELCLLLIWVASLVIAVTTAARQIPSEREQRTIFPLLAKPVSRNQLVIGKFWGCWQAVGLAVAVFYLFFTVLSGAKEHAWPLAAYFQGLVLHWFMLGIVLAMTMLGSIAFAAPSSNSTIIFVVAAGILLLGRHLNKVALQFSDPMQTIIYSIYFAIPHLDLFDVRDLLIHDLGTIPWLVWLAAMGYACAYIGFFLLAACFAFKRKPVN